MRKVKQPVFFIVLLCIIAFGYLTYAGIHTQYGDIKTSSIKGVEDIRWGIDIQGGVNARLNLPIITTPQRKKWTLQRLLSSKDL